MPATTQQFYDQSYFNEMRGSRALYEHFLGLMDCLHQEKLVVLDIGCGRGELLELLSRRPNVEFLAGLDFSATAITESRERLGQHDLSCQCNLIQGSVDDVRLCDENSFDVIYMTDVVEHLPAPVLAAALRNAHYWLKPGGYLIIHTFPTLGPHRLFRFVLKVLRKSESLRKLDSIHCNVQSRKTLLGHVRAAGLRCERIWLQNDVTLTSNEYHRLKPEFAKKLVRFVLENVLQHNSVTRAATGVGLLEFISPSIYAVTRKDEV